jgi:hypothetical protein
MGTRTMTGKNPVTGGNGFLVIESVVIRFNIVTLLVHELDILTVPSFCFTSNETRRLYRTEEYHRCAGLRSTTTVQD